MRHVCAFAFGLVLFTLPAMADTSSIAMLTKPDAQKILQAGWQNTREITIAAIVQGVDLKRNSVGACVATVIGTCGYPMQARPNGPIVYTAHTFSEVLYYDYELGWFMLSAGDAFDYDARSKELAVTTTAGRKVFPATPHRP